MEESGRQIGMVRMELCTSMLPTVLGVQWKRTAVVMLPQITEGPALARETRGRRHLCLTENTTDRKLTLLWWVATE